MTVTPKVVAISGPSSSGKSYFGQTLTRNLHRVFPNSVILYEDDFYLADSAIPIDPETGEQNWDCPEAFDLDHMKEVLDHAKTHGKLPEKFVSLEETQTLGENPVDEEELAQIRDSLDASVCSSNIIFVDGIMLFHKQSPLYGSFDTRLMLRAPYSTLKSRREAREGYATLEGFWTDPPGYFDNIVWPQYVRNHKYLFTNEDVEKGTLVDPKIHMPESVSWEPKQVLQWAVSMLT